MIKRKITFIRSEFKCIAVEGGGKHRLLQRFNETLYINTRYDTQAYDTRFVSILNRSFTSFECWYCKGKDTFLTQETFPYIAKQLNEIQL